MCEVVVVRHIHQHRTMRGHSGSVWALQVSNGLLISGAHDNMVHECCIFTVSRVCVCVCVCVCNVVFACFLSFVV